MKGLRCGRKGVPGDHMLMFELLHLNMAKAGLVSGTFLIPYFAPRKEQEIRLLVGNDKQMVRSKAQNSCRQGKVGPAWHQMPVQGRALHLLWDPSAHLRDFPRHSQFYLYNGNK